MKKVNIISLGGISRVAIEFLNDKIPYNKICIFDDNTELLNKKYNNILVKGSLKDLYNLETDCLYFNGIGRFDMYGQRIDISKVLQLKGFKGYSIIHESVIVSPTAKIEGGVFLSSAVSVGYSSYIGDDSVVWSNVTIGNENKIGKLVYISPGVTTCGKVKIGNYSYIGPGAVITAGVKIGNKCIIGAGSIVLKDVPDNSFVIGNPARVIKENVLW